MILLSNNLSLLYPKPGSTSQPTMTTPNYGRDQRRDEGTEPLLAPPPPPYRDDHSRTSGRAWSRKGCLRTLLFGLFIYSAISVVIGGMVWFADKYHGLQFGNIRGRISTPRVPNGRDVVAGPDGSDGEVLKCHLPFLPYDKGPIYTVVNDPAYHGVFELDFVNGSYVEMGRPPFAAITAFDLPSTASLVYFLSRTGRSRGSIKFLPAVQGEDTIQVKIVTRYSTLAERASVNICTLKKDQGVYGVGIYTDAANPKGAYLVFDITVTIPPPKSPNGALRSIETNMPLFAHEFEDFRNMFFRHIDLTTSFVHIRVKSLQAHSIAARTEFAPIAGVFRVEQSLNLLTSSAYIEAKIEAQNADWRTPASVSLTTSNARMDAEVMLTSPSDTSGKEVGIGMEATTSNGQLNLAVTSAPPESHIQLNAATTNADAHTSLPAAFSGQLMLVNRNGKMRVNNNISAEDPTGAGNKRKHQVFFVNQHSLSGRVSWGVEQDYREIGAAVVSTMNGQNIVNLL